MVKRPFGGGESSRGADSSSTDVTTLRGRGREVEVETDREDRCLVLVAAERDLSNTPSQDKTCL